MHIAFAIAFFVFVGLCETLRHGIFGLTPSETTGIIYGALVLMALLILRGDIVYILRPPRESLYGEPRLRWTLGRSVLGLVLAPMLWLIPIVFGLTLIQINLQPVSAEDLIHVLALHLFLVAFAQEAFFREAVVKAFGSDVFAMFLVAGLCSFIFHMPEGVPAAAIAGGTGVFFMGLRLIGCSILVIAFAHATTTVVFTEVVSLGLTGQDAWTYAAIFLGASVTMAALIYSIFAPNRRRFEYA